MLSVIMLSVIMLSVIMLNVIMPSVFMLSVIILIVNMLSVVILSVLALIYELYISFQHGRPKSAKAVFLVTDGYSNGGDPVPAADLVNLVSGPGIEPGTLSFIFKHSTTELIRSHFDLFKITNRTAHIRHQCRKTAVFSCHICLNNTDQA